jgi:apolipoprotein N-acyltransferase
MPTVRVAAIQPNLPRAAHVDKATPPEQRLATLAAQTRAAAAQGAQIVVWPEMVLGFDPQVAYTQELKALAVETRTYLVIGYVLDNEKGFRNEATVLSPAGQFLGVYGKSHPFIAAGEPEGISAGTYPVYHTPLGRLATMICFDASFTDVARLLGGQGAQLIANPSLFGPPIAELPYTQVVLRAIENRAAIVMADVAYNSAIVDSYGRVLKLAITPGGAQTTLVADVPAGTGSTLYSRLGDWLGWLSLAGLAFFAVFMTVTLRRTEGA